MSKEVEQKVVEMRFDNRQFEQNVKTTMSTLDRLKAALSFKGSVQGLDSINNASRHNNVGLLGQAAEAVSVKFSAMEVVAITALSNITNSVLNTGKHILNSLTVAPISAGFKEYETQINAVQTILANTSMDGTGIEQVNAALDELNLYADKTIYNFTEMTRNIGTFTAAGVKLDTSVQAIKGIANLAALSGSNAEQASRAMYQLSQALASGRVTLQDWNSVVNAGMGGKVFQNALMDTAEAMGIVVNRTQSFRESISASGNQDSWLTSEVLLNTLRQFTGDLTDAELAQMGFNKAQIETIQNMAFTANEAATRVKTATQLYDTLAESVQSGWTQTWELIFGDFEEAKEFFTNVSNLLSDFINKTSEARNNFVESVVKSPWKQFSEQVTNAGLDMEDFQERAWEMAKEYGLVTDELMENAGSFEKTLKNGWLNSEIVSKTLEEYASSSKNAARDTEFFTKKLKDFQVLVKDIWEGDYENQKDRIEALTKAGYKYSDVEELVSKTIKGTAISVKDLSYQQLKAIGFTEEQTKALYDLAKSARRAESPIGKLIDSFSKDNGRELFLDSFYNVLKSILTVLSTIGDAWSSVFSIDPMTVYGMIEAFNKFTSGLVLSSEASNKLRNALEGLFSIFDIFREIIVETFNSLYLVIKEIIGPINVDFLGILSDAGLALTEFRKNLNISEDFDKINAKISEFIANIKRIISSSVKFDSDSMTALSESIGGFFEALKNGSKNIDISKIIGTGALGGLSVGLYKIVQKLKTPVKEFFDIFDEEEGPVSTIKASLTAVKDSLESVQKSIQADTIEKIAKSIGILTLSIVGLSLLDYERVNQSVIAMGIIIAELFSAFSSFGAIVATNGLKGAGGIGIISSSLLMLSFAIIGFAGAVTVLSKIDLLDLVKGIGGIGILLTEIIAFLSYADFTKFGTIKSGGIILLAIGLNILASAVSNFGKMNLPELGKGLLGLGVVLAELSFYLDQTMNAKNVIKTAIGIGILGGAMIIFTKVIEKLGNLSYEELVKGIGSLTIALFAIGAALDTFPRDIIGISIGLTIMGGALSIVTSSIGKLSAYSLVELGKGLASIGIALAEFALALNYMKGTVGGAFALIVASGAINLMVPAIRSLGELPLAQLIKGLGAFAGALFIFGAAGSILAPMAPGLLAISVAIGLLGGAILMTGAGIASFATGVLALSGSVAAVATTITGIIAAIASGIAVGIPSIVTALAKGVLTFATTIANGASALLDAGIVLLGALSEAIIFSIPTIVTTIGELLVAVLTAVHNYAPTIIDTVLKIIVDIIVALASFVPTFIQTGIDLAVSFINGLADGIRNNAPVIFAAVKNLLSSIIELLITGVQELLSVIPIVGDNLAEALGGLKDKVRETLAPEDMQTYGTNATNGIVSGMQGGSAMLSSVAFGIGELVENGLRSGAGDTYSIGQTQAEEYTSAIANETESVRTAASTLSTTALEAVQHQTPEFETAGTDLGSSFVSGLSSNSESAKLAGFTLKDLSISNLITSSVEFLQAGTDSGMNYTTGLSNTSDNAKKSGSIVSDKAASGANENVGKFNDIGDNAGRGFYNGILAWAERAAEAAREMVRSAIEAAEDELDSHSPSRVFVELGKNTDEGFIIGIRSMIGKVERESSKMSKSAIDIVSESVNQLSDLISKDIDTTPVIRPILDLSGARKEALKINSLFIEDQALKINSSVNRKRTSSVENQNGEKKESTVEQFNFTQNNYSPKALNRKEIYRQTRNQFAMAKGVVSKT